MWRCDLITMAGHGEILGVALNRTEERIAGAILIYQMIEFLYHPVFNKNTSTSTIFRKTDTGVCNVRWGGVTEGGRIFIGSDRNFDGVQGRARDWAEHVFPDTRHVLIRLSACTQAGLLVQFQVGFCC